MGAEPRCEVGAGDVSTIEGGGEVMRLGCDKGDVGVESARGNEERGRRGDAMWVRASETGDEGECEDATECREDEGWPL